MIQSNRKHAWEGLSLIDRIGFYAVSTIYHTHNGVGLSLKKRTTWLVDWLIGWIQFYAVSAVFQPCNGGSLSLKKRNTWLIDWLDRVLRRIYAVFQPCNGRGTCGLKLLYVLGNTINYVSCSALRSGLEPPSSYELNILGREEEYQREKLIQMFKCIFLIKERYRKQEIKKENLYFIF